VQTGKGGEGVNGAHLHKNLENEGRLGIGLKISTKYICLKRAAKMKGIIHVDHRGGTHKRCGRILHRTGEGGRKTFGSPPTLGVRFPGDWKAQNFVSITRSGGGEQKNTNGSKNTLLNVGREVLRISTDRLLSRLWVL